LFSTCVLAVIQLYYSLLDVVGKELFIRGLPNNITEDLLIKFFKKSGIAVESVNLFAAKGLVTNR
jgi:hypothetical protein